MASAWVNAASCALVHCAGSRSHTESTIRAWPGADCVADWNAVYCWSDRRRRSATPWSRVSASDVVRIAGAPDPPEASEVVVPEEEGWIPSRPKSAPRRSPTAVARSSIEAAKAVAIGADGSGGTRPVASDASSVAMRTSASSWAWTWCRPRPGASLMNVESAEALALELVTIGTACAA